MQLRKISEQIHVFRLERALLGLLDVVELVIGHGVKEIGLCGIQFIEIQDITSAEVTMIQKIVTDDVICELKDMGLISCFVRHCSKRQIGRKKPTIDVGSACMSRV